MTPQVSLSPFLFSQLAHSPLPPAGPLSLREDGELPVIILVDIGVGVGVDGEKMEVIACR